MTVSKFSEQQIALILKQVDDDVSIDEVCREAVSCSPSLDRPSGRFQGVLSCSPSLDRPSGRFQGVLSCSPSLDRPSGRFQGVFGQGGPCAPDRFTSAIGGL
jgi:hypothetical protein